MAQPTMKPVSYEDLLALPPHVVGEIVDGELHVSPRPRVPHARASSVLAGKLGDSFDFGASGPGGWIILFETEIHVLNDVVVPDLAGWRRERMPVLEDVPYMTLAPDWVCEVLSPSTEKLDRGKKLAVYARERVPHVWFVDPKARAVEAMHLDGADYRTVVVRDDARVRLPPFDAIELDLARLWML